MVSTQMLHKAEPLGISKTAVEALAEEVANKTKFKPGNDLRDLVFRLGGVVQFVDVWEFGELGSLIVDDEGDFEIHLPVHTSPEKNQFTLAHELGHLILHYMWPRAEGAKLHGLVANRYGDDRSEAEANWFAAAFLMPGGLFRAAFKRYSGNISKLSEHFLVPVSLVKARAESLSLSLEHGK